MCLGGGGGTTQSTTFSPPDYTKQGWLDYLTGAQNLANKGLPQYGGQTVANQSPMTGIGLQMLTDYATQGTPERTAAGQALTGAMQGTINPYATSVNPFIGNNPYLSRMVSDINQQTTDAYQRGTAAQTDAAAARSGAYGGSAYQDMVGQNQLNLARQLSSNANNLYGQNYQQSAQLADAGLNRAAQGWQSGVGNALQGAQISQGQQGLDAQAIQQLLAGGQIPQQYQQQLLNAASQYIGQGQQIPFTLSDFIGSVLSRASGGQGTTTQVGPGQSPLTGLLGGGALGLGLYNAFGRSG